MICCYLFLFYRAYRERPDYKKTILGINKSKCAIENSLSRTNRFNFLQMKDIIEEIIAEEEYRSKEAERYIFSLFRAQSFTSLKADLHQDINGGFPFSRRLNGTFP